MANTANTAGTLDVVAAVDQDRLWQRHMEIAKFGATGRGGVNRLALTQDDTNARKAVLEWCRARGMSATIDDIGNLFIRREGTEPGAAPVVSGSHLDTQPAGGNFDGVYGVLAAVEVLCAAEDAGIKTKRALEAVVWTNEEGARFQPTTLGANVFAGGIPLDVALDKIDRDGIRLGDALAESLEHLNVSEKHLFQFPIHAYLETHIEQGPVLENAGKQVGVVTGIQGLRWFEIVVSGEEGHAGTVPMADRKDAVAAAARMVIALGEMMEDATDIVRFNVGRFEVTPNSPNTIPGQVLFTIDFRHPDAQTLKRLGDKVDPICQAQAGACTVVVRETIDSAPTTFDASIRRAISNAAERQKIPQMELISGATHDAKYMADLYRAGMIFIPCKGGVSHNEAESATPEDLAAGAKVLAEVMLGLANE